MPPTRNCSCECATWWHHLLGVTETAGPWGSCSQSHLLCPEREQNKVRAWHGIVRVWDVQKNLQNPEELLAPSHRVVPTRWETVSNRISLPAVSKENSKVGYLYCHSGDSTWIPCWSSARKFCEHISPPSSETYKPERNPKRNVKWLVLNSQSAERTGCGASLEERLESKPWMPSRHTMPSQRMEILHRSLCQAQRWWWFILVLSGGPSLAHMEAPSPSTMPGLGLPCPAAPHPQGQLGFPIKLLLPSPDLPGTHGVHLCSL